MTIENRVQAAEIVKRARAELPVLQAQAMALKARIGTFGEMAADKAALEELEHKIVNTQCKAWAPY